MNAQRVLWVGATTVGLIAGGFVLHFPGSFAGQSEWSVSAGVFGALLGALNGLAVGLLQRLALGRRAASSVIVWMALAVGLTHALFDASASGSSIVLVAGFAGLAVAAAYVFAVRDRSIGRVALVAVAWSVFLVVANNVSNAIGLPFEENPFGWASDHGFDGLVVGLGWGVALAIAGVVEQLPGPKSLAGKPATTPAHLADQPSPPAP